MTARKSAAPPFYRRESIAIAVFLITEGRPLWNRDCHSKAIFRLQESIFSLISGEHIRLKIDK
jgi:predicted NUDIX family NTP pyrophosphohydrolase